MKGLLLLLMLFGHETPAWVKSLRGTIVYTRRTFLGLNVIYRVDANGDHSKKLYEHTDPKSRDAMFPRWSADGKEVELAAMRGGKWRKHRLAIADGKVTPTEDEADILSRDVRDEGLSVERGELFVKQADGTKKRVFSYSDWDGKMKEGASEASFGPDRSYVVFQVCSYGKCTIHVARTDGGGEAEITEGRQPSWR